MEFVSFDEWKRRKESNKNNSPASTSSSAPGSSDRNAGFVTFDEWRAARPEIATPKRSAYTNAENWQREAQAVLRDYGDFAQNWSNDNLAYETYRKRMNDYVSQFDSVYSGLDGSYSWQESVSATQNALRQALRNLDSVRDSWGQWGSQEEYDNDLQWQQDVEGLDLAEAWGEVNRMKGERNALVGQINADDTANQFDLARNTRPAAQQVTPEEFANMSASEYFEMADGLRGDQQEDSRMWMVDDYDQRIRTREAYLNSIENARRLGELESFAANDTDFGSLSQYEEHQYSGNSFNQPEAYAIEQYLNNPETRDRVKNDIAHGGVGLGIYSEDLSVLDVMSDEEISVFNYYFNTQGEEAAMDYINALSPTIRRRRAAERIEELKGRTLAEIAFAVPVGLDQFSSGVSGLFSNETQTPTWRQYAAQGVREDLADNRLFRNSDAKNSLGQVAFDAATSISNMTPSILASSLVGLINPVAGQVVGSTLMGASAAGNAYQEMLNAGYDSKSARGYGVLVGASEAVLGSLLGGITKLGGALPNGVTDLLLSNIDNAVARVAITIGANAFGEFSEEYLQTVLEPYFQNLLLGTNNDVKFFTEDALYSGILGAITAGLMEGPGTISGAVSTAKTGKNFRGSVADLDQLIELGRSLSESPDVQSLAAKTNADSSNYQVGRLVQGVSESIDANTRDSLVKRYTEYGLSSKDASAVADMVVATINGKGLTRSQLRLLSSNEVLSDAYHSSLNGMDREMQRADTFRALSLASKFQKPDASAKPQNAPTSTETKTTNVQEEVQGNVSQAKPRGTSTPLDAVANKYGISKEAVSYIAQDVENDADATSLANETDAVLRYVTESDKTADEAMSAIRENNLATALNDRQLRLAINLGIDARNDKSSQMTRAYEMGHAGQDIDDVLSSQNLSSLTEEERREAFNRGAADLKAKTDKAPAKRATEWREGSVRFDGNEKQIRDFLNSDKRTKADLEILRKIARVTGKDIVLYDGGVDAAGNLSAETGKFDPNKPNEVRVEIHAGISNASEIGHFASYALLRTFTHEFTHSMEVNAPAEYAELKRVVFAQMRKNGANVEQLIERKLIAGGVDADGNYNLSYDDASHEVLADAMVDILPQTSFIETLANEHQSLFHKILASIKEFMERIRQRLSEIAGETTAEAKAAMQTIDGAMKYAQSIVDAFDKAAVATANTVHNRETAEETGGTDESKNPAAENATEGNTVTPPIDPKIVSYFKSKNNVMRKIAVFEYEGRSYVTDGALAIATTPEGVQYARENLGAGELDSRSAKIAFAGADTLITQGPLEGKTENGAVYRFLVGEKKIFVNRKRFSFLDGGLLYANAERLGAIKSVDTNGEVVGYILPLKLRKEPEDMQPAKTRSFSQKMRRIIEETASQKNENPTGKVRYNLRNTKNMLWEEQVRGVLKHQSTVKRNDTLHLGDTPRYLVSDGMSQKPLAMPVRVFTKSHSGKDFTHAITEKNLYKIGQGIKNAPVVVDDPSRNSVVFVTNVFQDGYPVVVAFKKDSVFDGDNVHEATTMHLRTNVSSYLEGLSNTATVYVANKKEPFAAVGVANNLRSLAANIRFMDDIISPPDSSVNPSREQRRENLTDRSVISRSYDLISAISEKGKVVGDIGSANVDDIIAFRDSLKEGERFLLETLVERLDKLSDLQAQRREQGRIYSENMYRKDGNREEAAKARKRMDLLDKQIDEASKAVREAEHGAAYKPLLAKARKLTEQTERGRVKTEVERYRDQRFRSGQLRQRRESIIRSAEELESLLNKGNKKRNVKKDMQGLAAGAADLYNVLFNEEMNSPKYSKLFNERIVRNGFGVILSTKEATHAEEAKNILAKMERGRTQELENQLAYRMGQLHDALERERERINSINAGDVFQRIADEYKNLQTSGYDYIRGAFSEDAYNHLLQLKDKVGTTAARDMTISQLIDLDNAYRVVLTTIRNANKLFIDGQKQTVQQAGNRVIVEVGRNARKNKSLTNPGKVVATFTWNNEKPIYAFERIGSDTLTNLFWNIRSGEDVWIVDVEEAKAYRQAQAKKYGYDSWDAEKRYEFKSTDGATFSLTLEQLMSLYAYSKREQATEHLLKGGVVLAGAEVIVNGKRLVNDDATAYAIPADTLAKIGESLTADQRGYVDAMQDYLSREMARKGNEISMQIYGIELFGEKNYFPINSSGIYNEKAEQQFRQKENGQISIVNSGFTKSTAPKASNPVRLSGFSDVWASHVNEMSMYHAFVLPLEDFRRVRNFQTTTENGTKGDGVIAAIQNAQGSAAVKYINQLLEDLNGGTISDDRESGLKKLTSKFKKAATMASLSVVVQQISSLPRAWAVIDAKYFAGNVNKQKYSATLAEMRKYAPVMMIKEMGHFDTGMGRSVTEYINAREYTGKERFGAFFKDSGYRDEILGKAPAKVDEIAWMSIWEACKNETHAKYPNMSVTSDAFLKAVGKRFTEVIVKTQVYDSTLTKSANMRSKSALMGMVTSFLAEPTVTANMFFNALRSKDSKAIGKTVGALVVSAIANNFLASAVYAMRDDDEDETYWEKYLQAFIAGMADSLNPLTWLPFLRDVWSVLQGFDVQRADMNIISAVVDSVKNFVRSSASWSDDMTDEEKKAYWKEFGLSSANILLTVSNAFGIPLKNIYREGAAIFNTFKMANDEVHGNGRKMGEKIWDDIRASTPILGWIPKTESKTDRLYDAIVSGDAGYQERAQLTYASEKSYENAVRKALRENDPRIEAAARARMSGNLAEYARLFLEIDGEGRFEPATIMAAINSAENALTPDEESAASEAPQTLFTIGNYYTALAAGDEASAQLAYEELYQQKIAEGYLASEARSSVENSLATQIGQAYRDGDIDREQALRLLEENTEEHGEYDIAKWDFQRKYDFSWGSREREYRIGNISRDALIQEYMSIEGETRADAIEYVDELDFENREGYNYSEIDEEYAAGNINRQQAASRFIEAGFTAEEAEEKLVVIDFEQEFSGTDGISYAAVTDYRTYCEPVGIGGKAFYDAWKTFNGIESSRDANGDVIDGQSKKDKALAYIDSLPYSSAQKDGLYLSFGYAESRIYEAPWH